MQSKNSVLAYPDSDPILSFGFSSESILDETRKIVRTPVFASSPILKKFLEFVIQECVCGKSNQLKAYTIAVNVLGKPVNFDAQANGIVRIHARRLRRALNYYYRSDGALDAIRISIPKGGYVPVFSDNDSSLSVPLFNNDRQRRTVVSVVMPFIRLSKSSKENSLVVGLEEQLNVALMDLENCTVISYYALDKLMPPNSTISQFISEFGIDYLIMGDIQICKSKSRIHVQLVSARTGQQVWNETFDKTITLENIFQAQNEIAKSVVVNLEGLAL